MAAFACPRHFLNAAARHRPRFLPLPAAPPPPPPTSNHGRSAVRPQGWHGPQLHRPRHARGPPPHDRLPHQLAQLLVPRGCAPRPPHTPASAGGPQCPVAPAAPRAAPRPRPPRRLRDGRHCSGAAGAGAPAARGPGPQRHELRRSPAQVPAARPCCGSRRCAAGVPWWSSPTTRRAWAAPLRAPTGGGMGPRRAPRSRCRLRAGRTRAAAAAAASPMDQAAPQPPAAPRQLSLPNPPRHRPLPCPCPLPSHHPQAPQEDLGLPHAHAEPHRPQGAGSPQEEGPRQPVPSQREEVWRQEVGA